ncbi:hypothetical protein B0H10DRAFT_1996954, partial [Mycena sp. CBHHK59/15]
MGLEKIRKSGADILFQSSRLSFLAISQCDLLKECLKANTPCYYRGVTLLRCQSSYVALLGSHVEKASLSERVKPKLVLSRLQWVSFLQPPCTSHQSMPAICTLASRRSPRLSIQDLQEDEGWENSAELLYPDFDPTTVALPLLPSTQSPSASPIVLPTLPAPSRTSHARQRPEHHIPRPPNAFILYRTDYCIWNKQLASGERDHRVVSKLAGEAWRHLHPESRAKYEEMAQERKRLHAIKYPHYRRTSTARSRGIGRKRKAEDDCDYQGHASHWCRRGSRDHTKPSPVTVDLESEDIADFSSPPSNSYKRARITLTTRSSAPSPEVDHSRTPELSPNSSSESPASDLSLRTPAVPQPGLTCEEGFIATADIPPLDLSASAPQEVGSLSPSTAIRS